MPQVREVSTQRKEGILDAAIGVFGHHGFRKTSMDDIAKAAEISKQGLYLHYASKEEIFLEATKKYLDDGLELVQQKLDRHGVSLFKRLMGAMDVWFGRHFDTFSPGSFDVIEVGNRLSENGTEEYKTAFKAKLAKALTESADFKKTKNLCSPKEVAQVLFEFGLSWKESHSSREHFMKKVALCIKACCQVEG